MFLGQLARAVDRYGVICHAYCLMGNHYHLVLETPRANLPIVMRHVNGCYTRAFNATEGRVGHLFEGRYRAVLVEKDAHLLEIVRYVALNPTRARPAFCERPEEWPWSSYPALLGSVATPTWLTRDWLLGQLGASRDVARRRVKRFVDEGLASSDRAIEDGIFAGDELVRARTAGLEPIPEVPRSHWQPLRPTLERMLRDKRGPDPHRLSTVRLHGRESQTRPAAATRRSAAACGRARALIECKT